MKAGEVILGSRLTHSSGSYAYKTNPSFGIVSLTTKDGVRNVLDAQGSQSFFSGEQVLAIDVLNPVDKETVRVIERWRFSFSPPSSPGQNSAIKDKTIMRRLTTGIRSLLSYSRLLPAYSVFRLAHVDKMKQQATHTHTIRMDTEAVFNNNPIPGCKDEEFICFASSVGTLRLQVSHVQNPLGLLGVSYAESSGKQACLTEELKFEEGYVEKESEDRERKRWGSEGTSQCSTTPDNTVLFPPSSTPPFGSSAGAPRSCREESGRGMTQPESASSTSIVDGSLQGGLEGSFTSTPRGIKPLVSDLGDVWAIPGQGDEPKTHGAPPRIRNGATVEESSDTGEICILGFESDDEADNSRPVAPHASDCFQSDYHVPVFSAGRDTNIFSPRTGRTATTEYFSMRDSTSAAFLDCKERQNGDEECDFYDTG